MFFIDHENLNILKPATKEQRKIENNETNLFAKNLRAEVNEEDFKKAFSKYGNITSLLIRKPST